MSGRLLIGALLVALSFLLDDWMLHSFQFDRFPSLRGWFSAASPFGRALMPICLALGWAVAGWHRGERRWLRFASRLILSALIAGAIVSILKPAIGRQEPEIDPDQGRGAIAQRWGRFPSGDTAVAFSTASALASGYGAAAIPLFLFAGFVGLGRVYAQAHLISDVVAGAMVGLFAAAISRRLVPIDPRPLAGGTERVNTPPDRLADGRRQALLLIALAVPVLVWQLGSYPLADPDEGRYVAIPHAMMKSGDFLVPRLNSTVYFEKPPLVYWLTAGALRLFNDNEWAARTVPALFGALGVLIAAIFARSFLSKRSGLFAGGVLLSSLVWGAISRVLLLDIVLATLIWLALALYWAGARRSGGPNLPIVIGFWSACAAATLTKGPVAMVLVIGSIVGYLLLARERRGWWLRRWLWGVPLYFAIAAPWFILIGAREPSFNHFFWVRQHLERFLGSDGAQEHVQPFWYFGPILLAALLPWTLFLYRPLVGALRRPWRPRHPAAQARLFLIVSAGFIVLFFSASSCKLATYILPAVPPLAVLIGDRLARASRLTRHRVTKLLRNEIVVSLVALGLGGIGLAIAGGKALEIGEGLAPWPAQLLGGLLALGAVIAALIWRRHGVTGFVCATAIFSAVSIVGLVEMMPGISQSRAVKPLLAAIKPGLKAGGEVVTYNAFTQSLEFYLDRRIRVFGSPAEATFGYSQLPREEHQRWQMENFHDLASYLSTQEPVYVVVQDHDAAQRILPRLGGGAQEVVWNLRRSIIANAAAVALTPPQGQLAAEWR